MEEDHLGRAWRRRGFLGVVRGAWTRNRIADEKCTDFNISGFIVMSDDKEAQEDELLALTNIYEPDVFKQGKDGACNGGIFYAQLDLPMPFKIVIMDEGKQTP